ncbi:MAG: hypothetical protein V4616_12980 [Bacteroidota bacterium]
MSWVALSLSFVLLVGFTAVQRAARKCISVDILLDENSGLFFVSKDDVTNKIRTVHESVVGMEVEKINIDALEQAVKQLPEVDEVEVYTMLDGKLSVNVTQRRPIARVMPARGSGYYIDDKGRYMPLSKNYSARVFVVSGEITQRFRNISMNYLAENDSIKQLTLFDEIFELADFIDKDPFWKAQIQHAYVNENKEFDLIPRIGNHNIELGNTTDLPKKFDKLMIFYKEGLPYSDWNRYSKISLKFENQVVCTIKELPL